MAKRLSVRRGLIAIARFMAQWLMAAFELVTWARDAFGWWLWGRRETREFRRVGSCAMTGQCCKQLGLEVPRCWLRWPRWMYAIRRWHQLRYNFRYLGQRDNMLVYACRYQGADNRCSIHWRRPRLCRDYPGHPAHGQVRLHRGCGYRYEPFAAAAFRQRMLSAKPEPPVKRAAAEVKPEDVSETVD